MTPVSATDLKPHEVQALNAALETLVHEDWRKNITMPLATDVSPDLQTPLKSKSIGVTPRGIGQILREAGEW